MKAVILLAGGAAALGWLARRRGLLGFGVGAAQKDPTIAHVPESSMPWMPQRTAPAGADPSPPRTPAQPEGPGPDERSS